MLMYAPKEVQERAQWRPARYDGPGFGTIDVRTGKPIELKTRARPRGDEKEGGGEVREGLTIVMREMTNQRSSRPCIVREARGDASEAATRRRRRCPPPPFFFSNSVMSRAESGRGPF